MLNARAEIDEDATFFQVTSLVFDVRVNLEFSPQAATKGRRARPRAFERRDANEVMSWIRILSVLRSIVFMRLRIEL